MEWRNTYAPTAEAVNGAKHRFTNHSTLCRAVFLYSNPPLFQHSTAPKSHRKWQSLYGFHRQSRWISPGAEGAEITHRGGIRGPFRGPLPFLGGCPRGFFAPGHKSFLQRALRPRFSDRCGCGPGRKSIYSGYWCAVVDPVAAIPSCKGGMHTL